MAAPNLPSEVVAMLARHEVRAHHHLWHFVRRETAWNSLSPDDRSQLEQILLNLCLNAKQAMAEGGTITIVTRETRLTSSEAARCVPHDAKPGRYVELVVSDTGCGMDKDTVMRIFDPFFTSKAAGEGNGLGLTVAHGIVMDLGATIEATSTVGEGTEFRIEFPASPIVA